MSQELVGPQGGGRVCAHCRLPPRVWPASPSHALLAELALATTSPVTETLQVGMEERHLLPPSCSHEEAEVWRGTGLHSSLAWLEIEPGSQIYRRASDRTWSCGQTTWAGDQTFPTR